MRSALSPHQLRELAVLASCDPRTAQRFVQGEAVRGTAFDRLQIAARQLGIVLANQNAPAPNAPAMISSLGKSA
jgi:hypothetical protein